MAKSKRIAERLERTTVRNRGESRHEPTVGFAYQYQGRNSETPGPQQERAIGREEIKSRYDKMQDLSQQRDQRAFANAQQMDNEFWAGVDPRRRQEVADSGMIREDHTAMANLSRTAIHHEWPQAGYYSTPYLDDTVRGTEGE